MRQDIEFDAEGVTLRGWLYLPDGATGPVPTVVMVHGFSAVKEMYLDSYAEVFAAAGRPGPHRRVGVQLQRWPRAGARRDRQADRLRRRPGAAGQRLPQHPAPGASGLPRRQPRAVRPGPRRPLPG